MDRLLVRVALDSAGDAYLDAEREIVAAGDRVEPLLRAAAGKGGVEGAVAELLLGWPKAGKTWAACLAELTRLEESSKRTATGYPTAPQVADALSGKFGPACAPFLAVRVLKEAGSWPGWKEHGVLIYLHETGDVRAVEPLLALLWKVTHPVMRDEIIATLRDHTEPAVAARVKEELARYEATAAALRAAAERK